MKTSGFLLILPLLIFLSLPSKAQSWVWSQQFGAGGNESSEEVLQAANGDLFLAGSYSDEVMIGNQLLTSRGREDVYLARLDENGNPLWTISAGSVDVDLTRGISEDASGNLYWIGTYWREIDFSGQLLSSGSGAKAIFIVKYSPEGQLIWAQTILASGLKDIHDIEIDTDNNLLLTGYFGGTLSVSDTLIIANGEADLYVLKLNADGELIWAKAAGESGFIRGIKLKTDQEGRVNVTGYFKGEIILGTDSLRTNTSDNDVFVAQFDSNGNPLWGRKAGGVHEDYCTGLAIDEEKNLYITGYYYGVLKLGNGVEVQASGFHDNFFILKYASDGTPLWAKTFGGDGLAHALDVQYQNGELLLGGYFKEQLVIGANSLTAQADFDSFVAVFLSGSGELVWINQLTSSAFILLSKLLYLNEMEFLVAGSFTGTASFDQIDLTSSGAFNAFLLKGKLLSTSLSTTVKSAERLQIFPNPVQDLLHIKSASRLISIQVFNSLGQLVVRADSSTPFNVSTLPHGIYHLSILTESGQQTGSFVKN